MTSSDQNLDNVYLACTNFPVYMSFANFGRFRKIKFTQNFLLNGIRASKCTLKMHKIHISQNTQKKNMHKINSAKFLESINNRSIIISINHDLCQRLFLKRVAGFRPETLLKKRPWQRCFPVNVTKFLRTPFFQNTSGGCFYHLIVLLISTNDFERTVSDNENTGGEVRSSTMQTKELKKN